jgi:hypothetical protein
MTTTPSTRSAAERRQQIRAARTIFAGGNTISTLALFSFARAGNAEAAAVDGTSNP